MTKIYDFVKNNQVITFFCLSAFLGYAPWIFTGKPNWFIYGMLISGFILTSIFDGKKGVLDQLKNAVRVRSNYKNYLAVILILVISNLATLLAAFLFFGDKPFLYMFKYEPLGILILTFFVLLGGPIFEELFGLRGFALPKLLEKHSPLNSSIIVGFFFGAWHLIAFFDPGSSQYAIGLIYYPLFIVLEIASSIIMTWIYLKSDRNLFLGGIFFHLTMNMCDVLFQTDFRLSNMNAIPEINKHYFIIYSIIIIAVSVFIAVKNKMFKPTDKKQ
ncbi:MAG: hypothetical protein CVU39_14030 [Chloroflexi bacterium HGW-Chloroflexi-10]|nr:MAG: hypothetical protein CVU39_14030 [Chloroflexi bacterium HGW-Chloroflexi-10]